MKFLLKIFVVLGLSFYTLKAQPSLKAGNYQYTVVSIAGKGFGYLIKQNKKTVIKQEHIPSIQGIKAFSSKEDAEKCAKLVVKKLAKSGSLPTISKEELIKLNIKI